jgi:hypothetical protein
MLVFGLQLSRGQNLAFPRDEGKHAGVAFEIWMVLTHLTAPDGGTSLAGPLVASGISTSGKPATRNSRNKKEPRRLGCPQMMEDIRMGTRVCGLGVRTPWAPPGTVRG